MLREDVLEIGFFFFVQLTKLPIDQITTTGKSLVQRALRFPAAQFREKETLL